jgi:hypothetical protein
MAAVIYAWLFAAIMFLLVTDLSNPALKWIAVLGGIWMGVSGVMALYVRFRD